MVLNIDSPSLERNLERAAREQGVTPDELASRLLDAALPPLAVPGAPAHGG